PVGSPHVPEFALALPQLFYYNSGEFIRDINVGELHRLKFLSVFICLVEHLCLADSELIAFPAHVLDQDGEVKLAAARYLKAVGVVCLLDSEADVCVQLPEQPFTQMAGGDIFSFLACKGAVVDEELHGDRRLGDLLERDRLRFLGGAECVPDGDVRDSGDSDDGADRSLPDFNFVQSVKFVKLA